MQLHGELDGLEAATGSSGPKPKSRLCENSVSPIDNYLLRLLVVAKKGSNPFPHRQPEKNPRSVCCAIPLP